MTVTQPLQDMSDKELARQSRAGSLIAFEELVLRYEKRVYSFLCVRMPDPSDAEDLLQQVFIKAYRNIGRYNAKYAFYTWLLGIARREVAGFYRSWRGPPMEYENDMQMDMCDPSNLLDGREQGELIWNAAKQVLSDDQFTALLLVYREALSVKETAKVMKRAVSSIKVLLHRGRKRLMEQGRLEYNVPITNGVHAEESSCFVS
jgi:RNA polymerase sigma-70 factor (ECF subfamily)